MRKPTSTEFLRIFNSTIDWHHLGSKRVKAQVVMQAADIAAPDPNEGWTRFDDFTPTQIAKNLIRGWGPLEPVTADRWRHSVRVALAQYFGWDSSDEAIAERYETYDKEVQA